MKLGFRIVLAVLIALVGYGGLLVHDLYIKPYVLAESVVVINTNEPILTKYHVLKSEDLSVKKVAKESIPQNAIRNIQDVLGKMITHDVTNNQILTVHMVDIYDIYPGPDESYFPIPREAIYGINGSLRIFDKVDIYLYMPEQNTVRFQYELIEEDENEEVSNEPDEIVLTESSVFIKNAIVAHVRTEDNNDVMDSETGNVNDRKTSTGRISTPELIMNNEEGSQLLRKLEQGYKLWIVRNE